MNDIAILGLPPGLGLGAAEPWHAFPHGLAPRILRPRNLCEMRGLPYAKLVEGFIYVDTLLGIAMGERRYLENFGRALKDTFGSSVVDFGNPKLRPIDDKEEGGEHPPRVGWYVEELGGWSRFTGARQRVALIDYGITPDHSLLPSARNPALFGSTLHERADPSDVHGWHGSECAGVIAAQEHPLGNRVGVAPGCTLYVGQTRSAESSATAFDFIGLLAWAVHCCEVRVCSFSYALEASDVKRVMGRDLFSWVAQRLRAEQRTLIFCAAGNENVPLGQPAASEGVVAVSGFHYEDEPYRIVPSIHNAGFTPTDTKADFFLGPSFDVTTVSPDAVNPLRHNWGGTSAACAFVAGVAALYLEAFDALRRPYTLDQVVQRMKDDALPVCHRDRPGRTWNRISFPGSWASP
jgi:subtilisin family serine protease